MPRGVPHSDETKAQVMAALLAGQSVNSVARDYKISKATVIAWRNAAGLNGSTPVQPQKKAEIGDLIANYLRNVLRTLSVQAEQFSDKSWLAKQPGSEAAVLHGVLADKAIRILEALDTEPNRENETEEG